MIDSISTAVALAGVLFIHQVAIIYIAIAMLGFFAAGGALQTGLAVVQLFNPGTEGKKYWYLLYIHGCSKLPDSGSSSTAYKSHLVRQMQYTAS